MVQAPVLPADHAVGPPIPKCALLINPFYPKDPRASFGKHVLTPTLALTSIAGATPGDWQVRYWDENLLQGSPPTDPFPQVVGITVHLTFAKRAYQLAQWFRQRGAKVIFGGLHLLACPEEAAPHADALAIGDGVQLWPVILKDITEGRLQHDTAHVVFQPKQMTPEILMDGYSWCYRMLFSNGSIWRRRPTDWAAVPSYLAMSYLYKRSNRFWHLLIKHRLTAKVWRPLVECNRRRHLHFRRKLARSERWKMMKPGAVLAAGV